MQAAESKHLLDSRPHARLVHCFTMAKDELIDEHVSLHQSKLAVEALLSHASKVQEKKAQTELLPGKEQNVWLMVTVKQMHPEKKVKPHKM